MLMCVCVFCVELVLLSSGAEGCMKGQCTKLRLNGRVGNLYGSYDTSVRI